MSHHLERLILRDCHWVSKESIEYHAFHQGLSQNKEHLAGLKSCSVYRVSAKRNANPVHAKPKGCLTEVDLTGCWEMDDNVLKNFLSNFPRLSIVRLSNIYSLTDLTLRALATYTMDLTMLDITGCWRVSDQGVRHVAEYNRYKVKLYGVKTICF